MNKAYFIFILLCLILLNSCIEVDCNRCCTYEKQQEAWVYYKDGQYNVNNRLLVADGDTIDITIDGTGRTEEFLVDSITTFWKNNKIRPRQLNDAYDIRIDVTGRPLSNDASISLILDIGDQQYIPIVTREISFSSGIGIVKSKSVGFPIFCQETFLQNGGKLHLIAKGNLELLDFNIFIKE